MSSDCWEYEWEGRALSTYAHQPWPALVFRQDTPCFPLGFWLPLIREKPNLALEGETT